MANEVFQKRIADGVEKLLTEKSRARGTFQKHIKTFNRKWKQYQKAKQREEKTGEPQPFCPNPSQWQGEKWVCYYTYLAVVYDSVKNVAPYYLCNDILDEQLFGYLQRQISSANFDNDKLTTALKWVEADLEKQGGKAGDAKKPIKEVKPLPKGFSFGEGQAFFNRKDLKLSTGETVGILKKLADSVGKTVKHIELDSQSTESNASDFLRGRITAIRAALEKNKIPYRIRSMRGIGYVLEHT